MQQSSAVLVSGSNSGFGRLTVETLARHGHTVFAGVRHSTSKNAAAADELRSLAQRDALALHVVDLDVTDDASVERAVQAVIHAAGRLDVVVNNAGASAIGPTEAFSLDQVQQQFDTNVLSVFRMNRAAIPHMRAQGSGLLVQLGSVLSRVAYPFTGVYAASKFALEGLTEALRLELAAFGIDVVIIEPGTYPTNILANGITPADAARLDPYEEFFTHFGTTVAATMSGATGSIPNSQEVADAIAALIALPAGRRSLRTVVAITGQREGPLALNTTSDQVIAATRQALGWERFTTLKQEELA